MTTTISAPVVTDTSATVVTDTSATSVQAAAVPTVWRHGLVAGAIAAVATLAIALVADAVGVSFADTSGKRIPIAGFPEFTMVFALIGMGIAARMARRARHPHSTFVRTTVALTALSIVPDRTMGFDGGSAAVLVLTHVVAAAIVIPTLAARLRR